MLDAVEIGVIDGVWISLVSMSTIMVTDPRISVHLKCVNHHCQGDVGFLRDGRLAMAQLKLTMLNGSSRRQRVERVENQARVTVKISKRSLNLAYKICRRPRLLRRS